MNRIAMAAALSFGLVAWWGVSGRFRYREWARHRRMRADFKDIRGAIEQRLREIKEKKSG